MRRAIETKAEFARELTALKPMLSKYAETAPDATKQLLERELTNIDAELELVTKRPSAPPASR